MNCDEEANVANLTRISPYRARPSFPSTGKTLTSITEERAKPIRQAVALMRDAFEAQRMTHEFVAIFAPRWPGCGIVESDESLSSRAAWAVAEIWMVARLSGAVSPLASIEDAESWFLGNNHHELPSLAATLDRKTWLKAFWLLEEVNYDFAFADLLPYILDVHGPGSRQSVMRDASTATARAAKRKSGVFYTPADVAEYMARKALDDLDAVDHCIRCFDPACGTGVFLRALLNIAIERGCGQFDRFAFATESLYAVDIDPFAVETACFVLLYDCLVDVQKREIPPVQAWHALRLNFSVMDALHVAACSSTSKNHAEERAQIRKALLSGDYRFSGELDFGERADGDGDGWFGFLKDEKPVNVLFPEVADGFDVVIGNPPYAATGARHDTGYLELRYASLRGKLSPRDDLYPMFTEKTWQLSRPGRNSCAMVVPLSIAYHRGTQFRACRRNMVRQGGRWQFAFFDREPHALFGEDVKTRNAILFRRESDQDPPRGETAVIETGPLQKWTSRSRKKLFPSIGFTRLENAQVVAGIPKVSGSSQAHAAAVLLDRSDALVRLWSKARSSPPSEAFNQPDAPSVFIASTAYNFLNVFRPHLQRPQQRYPLTENPLMMLQFSGEPSAAVAFAILSSRLTFWLWHVQCDGFHVPRWFVESVPFSWRSFTDDQRERLCDWSGRLWDALQDHQIVSLNGGRETVAYRPLACERERDEIDRVLIDAAGLDPGFADELRQFVRATVVVDETDRRRKTFQTPFQRMESTPWQATVTRSEKRKVN